MKVELSQALVLHKLTIEHKPEWDTKGRIVYVPNPDRTPYRTARTKASTVSSATSA